MVADVYDLIERQAAQAAKPDPARLPQEFWEASPQLRHILNVSRMVHASPDLVLGNTIARLAALIGHRWVIPPYRGDERPLCVWVGNVGPSSAGKSIAHGIARKLLPHTPPRRNLHLVPATGEAWLESFWVERTDNDPATGKPIVLKEQAIDSALVVIDEGSLLAALFSRSGSTLQSFLLTMFHGGDVGTVTLDSQKRGLPRALRRGTYSVALSVAIQPALATQVLADEGVGWPQRFWWTKHGDHIADDRPLEPIRPLDWQPPSPGAGEHRMTMDGTNRRLIGYPDQAVQDTQNIAKADLLGLNPDPLAGNDHLLRLKLGFLLTQLHTGGQSVDVTPDDYDLAGVMVWTHQRVRQELVDHAARAAEAAKRAAVDLTTTSAVASEMAKEALWLGKAKEKVHAVLLANGGAATRNQIKARCSVNHRLVLDQVLADLAAEKIIGQGADGSWRYLKQE